MDNLILFLTLCAGAATAAFLVTLILLMVSRNNNKTLSSKIIQQGYKIEALSKNQDAFPKPDIRLVSSDYDEDYLRMTLNKRVDAA